MERMSYFLFKSEPSVYSFEDLVRDKETVWDGVTNPTAVMHLRQMNHSQKFWREVEQVCPAYRTAKRWLKEHPGLLSPT